MSSCFEDQRVGSILELAINNSEAAIIFFLYHSSKNYISHNLCVLYCKNLLVVCLPVEIIINASRSTCHYNFLDSDDSIYTAELFYGPKQKYLPILFKLKLPVYARQLWKTCIYHSQFIWMEKKPWIFRKFCRWKMNFKIAVRSQKVTDINNKHIFTWQKLIPSISSAFVI